MSSLPRAPVRNGELEYEVRGDGEPVLFIHGALISGAFDPLMDEASLANYRLINYHRRGYAGSTASNVSPDDHHERAAADAVALLEHVGEQRAHIVGHSSGGVIALQLVLDAPEIVDSLILLEPALHMFPSGVELMEEIEPVLERYHAGNSEEAVDRFLRAVVSEDWRTLAENTVPGAPEQAVQDAATFFELEIQAEADWKFDEEKAETFSRPVLYLQGSESIDMANDRNLVRSWFPQTEEYVVEGVNHALTWHDPQPVAEAIADFLNRHQS